MPAWCWNSILTYEVAGETFTAETFIYFTQEGYQHAYGQGPLKSSKYLMVEFLPRSFQATIPFRYEFKWITRKRRQLLWIFLASIMRKMILDSCIYQMK